MEPISTGMAVLGIGQMLGNLFGNLFGASKQASAAKQATDAQTRAANHAADLEYKALTEALDYQKQTDARDYRDWLNREARDRTDWEAQELRRAPFRALADSSVRTLADYIRVPGMHAAQEVPVQRWSAPQSYPSIDAYRQAGMAAGQDMSWMDQPGAIQTGQTRNTTMPVGGGRTLYDLSLAPTRQAPSPATADPGLLAKYGRRPQTLAGFVR